jgi:hypothetical protein
MISNTTMFTTARSYNNIEKLCNDGERAFPSPVNTQLQTLQRFRLEDAGTAEQGY